MMSPAATFITPIVVEQAMSLTPLSWQIVISSSISGMAALFIQLFIIRVAMAGSDIAHAVCYVTETKAYLDYNNRRYSVNLTRAGPTIRQIAAKVADSFEKNWTSATEYTFSYTDYRKTTRYTVVKTDPPEKDPDRQAAR